MDLGIKDKIAFVAGGSRGLGKAVARELAREGARVAICASTDRSLTEAQNEIANECGRDVYAVAADLSDAAQAKDCMRRTLEHFGKIDILINNAGGPPTGTFLEIDDDLWEYGFRLNLRSAIILTREVVPLMKRHMWGRIINITSIAVKQPIDGLILSNTIRSGVMGLAKTLATELAPFNITVNSVCPGYTLTNRVRNLARAAAQKEGTSAEAIIERWEGTIPMQRLGTPEEFAAVVAFLASARSSYITGAAIPIDGGWYRGIM